MSGSRDTITGITRRITRTTLLARLLVLYMVRHDQAPEWQLSYRFSPYGTPASQIDRPPRPLFVV